MLKNLVLFAALGLALLFRPVAAEAQINLVVTFSVFNNATNGTVLPAGFLPVDIHDVITGCGTGWSIVGSPGKNCTVSYQTGCHQIAGVQTDCPEDKTVSFSWTHQNSSGATTKGTCILDVSSSFSGLWTTTWSMNNDSVSQCTVMGNQSGTGGEYPTGSIVITVEPKSSW